MAVDITDFKIKLQIITYCNGLNLIEIGILYYYINMTYFFDLLNVKIEYYYSLKCTSTFFKCYSNTSEQLIFL